MLASKDLTQKKICVALATVERLVSAPKREGAPSNGTLPSSLSLNPKKLQNEATRQRPHKGGSFKQSPTLLPNQICCSCYGEATRQRPQKGGSFKQTDAYHQPTLQCTLHKMNSIINQSTLSLWIHQVQVLNIQTSGHDFPDLIHQRQIDLCVSVCLLSPSCICRQETLTPRPVSIHDIVYNGVLC